MEAPPDSGIWMIAGLKSVLGGCPDGGGHDGDRDTLGCEEGACLESIHEMCGYWDCPMRPRPDTASVETATPIMMYSDYPEPAHEAIWFGKDDPGRSLASGVYFCRVSTEKETAVAKMVLLR